MQTAQTAAQALLFLPFAAPIALWVAWNDMARMKIPNKAVLALVVVFAVVGLIAFPLADYGWRWTHLVVVLAIGFVASSAGLLGAGDAKFSAAMAPFIARDDVLLFAYLFAVVLLAGFVTHRLARRSAWVRARTPGWESWERKDFPMGLCLGSGLLVYLLLGVLQGA
jgi:prepilin peptidase CpaA